jgi:hypothetical protein
MVPLMKDIIGTERSTGKVFLDLQMALFMMAHLIIMRSVVKVNTHGLMENHMKVNGRIIKCMERENFIGLMAKFIQETS